MLEEMMVKCLLLLDGKNVVDKTLDERIHEACSRDHKWIHLTRLESFSREGNRN
jgi:hypothetical protein